MRAVRESTIFVAFIVGLVLAVSGFCQNPPPIPAVSDIHQGFIYQIVTDRFFNGDASNDDPAESAGEFDPKGFTTPAKWRDYWGGDLAGVTQKLTYLKSMGVTAIWISPPVDNANKPDGGGASGYHGYWPRDMMRIEEHFGDAGNSWAAFDKLTSAAHANGIKVIVDFVANHTNDIGVGGEWCALQQRREGGGLFKRYRNDSVLSPHAEYVGLRGSVPVAVRHAVRAG